MNKENQLGKLTDIFDKTFYNTPYGCFAEIGAFNGKTWSLGHYAATEYVWQGIMVEPNPVSADKCRDEFWDCLYVTVEEKAVSREKGKAKLYLGGTLSTLKEERVELYNHLKSTRRGWGAHQMSLDDYVEVETDTLQNILSDNDFHNLDLLTIDVEGAELDVLESMNWQIYQPGMVVVETHDKHDCRDLSKNSLKIDGFMFCHGYEKAGSDTVNTVYLKEEAT